MPLVSAPSLAIEAREVTKTFRSGWLRRRETVALRGVNLSVERGTIFGLLGPNGAGKTTLLSILSTLLTPDGGQVLVLGHDVTREAARVRRRLNMASGRPSFLWSLRVDEIVAFYGRLYGLSGQALRRRVDELIEQYELTPYRHIHPPHLDLAFRSVRGEFDLVELPNGRTRLTGRSWYNLDMRPHAYWAIWSDWLVHSIHGRVLRHIKRLCEDDTAT